MATTTSSATTGTPTTGGSNITTSTTAAATDCSVTNGTSTAAVADACSGGSNATTTAAVAAVTTTIDVNATTEPDYRYDFSDTAHYTYGIWNPTRYYDEYLRVVVWVGLGLSILSLTIFTLIIVWNKSLHLERYLVHLNLAIASLISSCTFLVVDVAKDDPPSCFVVSVVLQFSLLAMSVWLLNEGFYLFPAFTKGLLTGRMRYYIPLAWTIPMIIVVVCVNVGIDGYARDARCYLTFDEEHKWMFAGPALVVTVGVLVIFALLLCNISHPAIKDPVVKKELCSSFISYLLMVLILLSVWAFGGLASIHDDHVIYQMIFVGVMTIKGMLIFLVYGVLSPKFRHCLYPSKSSKLTPASQLTQLPSLKTEMSSGDPGLLPGGKAGFKAGQPLYIP